MSIFGRFLVGKGIVKAAKTALMAGASTAGVTAAASATNDVDFPATAAITLATWLIKFLADWRKHRK